jgi:quinol monooxygenase YgiN
MIKHVVMWKLYEENKATNAQIIKEKLEALVGVIPGLLEVEVGIDFNKSDAAFDVVLYSVLESRAALEAYQIHPAHQAVVPVVKAVSSQRAVVDYEV